MTAAGKRKTKGERPFHIGISSNAGRCKTGCRLARAVGSVIATLVRM